MMRRQNGRGYNMYFWAALLFVTPPRPTPQPNPPLPQQVVRLLQHWVITGKHAYRRGILRGDGRWLEPR